MAIDLKRKKGESAIETLPLPISPKLKERYRMLQSKLDRMGKESLHTHTRERISCLLDEVEAEISAG